MLIGCPKEIKNQEYRVGMTPAATREAVAHGHRVLIEAGAGAGAGFADADYTAAGAELTDGPERIFAEAALVEGEGTTAGRAGATARGPGAVHLSPPRPRPRPDP